MMSRFKNIKYSLVCRLSDVSQEVFLISDFLKRLDLDDDIAVRELRYLGQCTENRACDLDRAMDDLFDLANRVEANNELPDPDYINPLQ